MAAESLLYNLIHSLTRGEKRYLSIWIDQSFGRTANRYKILYQGLLEMSEFDEGRLREYLSENGGPSHLASSMSRLRDLILKCLRYKDEADTLSGRIQAILRNVEAAYTRRQYDLMGKKLRQGKTLALAYELYPEFLRILEWEEKKYLMHPNNSEGEFFSTISDQRQDCLKKMQDQSQLLSLQVQMRALVREKQQMRSDAGIAKAAELLLHPLLVTPPETGEFLASSYYWNTHGLYNMAVGEYSKGYRIYKDLVEMWKGCPDWIIHAPDDYLSILNNFLSANLFTLEENQDFLASAREAEGLPGLPSGLRVKIERITYMQKLLYMLNFGEYPETTMLIEEILDWLDSKKKLLSKAPVLIFYYNISTFYFVNSEFREANRVLLLILNFSAGPEREDIRDFARLFQLVLHYELGDTDLQYYLLRSAKRYFRRTQKLDDVESALITFFKKSLKLPNPDQKALHELKIRLQEILSDSTLRNPLGMQELLMWVNAKIEGTSLKEWNEARLKRQRELPKQEASTN